MDTPLKSDGQPRGAAGMLDPVAARMLAKVGDFVEPLTRFDRNDLKLVGCTLQKVQLSISQRADVSFSIKETAGNGPLGAGVRHADSADQYTTEAKTMLARARKDVGARLETWSRVNGLDLRALPKQDDVVAIPYPVGHAWACPSCRGRGKNPCTACGRSGKVNCTTCGATGRTNCGSCHGNGKMNCSGCGGQGGRNVQVEIPYWNAADNRQSVRYEYKWEQCWTCGGQRTVNCSSCGASGKTQCYTCHGAGNVTCNSCSGSGDVTCSSCAGYGWKHSVAALACEITRSFSVTVYSKDAEIAGVLGRLKTPEDVLAMVSAHHPLPQVGESVFARETRAEVNVAEADFMAGGAIATIRGFGPKLDIHDYKNIAGALLSADIAQLEKATAAARRFPPQVTSDLSEALRRTFTSEAHLAIAEKAGFALMPGELAKKADRLAAGDFKGVASADYVRRAAKAMANGVTRAYTAEMLRWPAFTLFTPVLALPANWLMWRMAPTNADLPVTVGFILIAIGATLAGHVAATFRLQKQVGGVKLNRVLDGLGLTWIWMTMAGVTALALTPVMSMIGRAFAFT